MNILNIDKIDSTEFKNIYRLVADSNNLIIDILENDPNVKNFLKINIRFYCADSTDFADFADLVEFTTMNGIVIDKIDSMYYISFGGLLCKVNEKFVPNFNKEDNIRVIYSTN